MAISRRTLFRTTGAAALGGLAAGAASGGVAAAADLSTAPQAKPVPAGPIPATSRDSVFTRAGAGPLYWTIYGWSYPHNAPIPEAEWQRNIDWVAGEFASCGYRIACTDGWIEGSQKTTPNGYITSYNDSWTHDWAWWAKYLRGKGMKLGVYYNPLWVTRSAVEDPTKTVVGRPDIPISSLVVPGDLFAGDLGGTELYWLDVTKDGAREYVQGYVDYFRRMGVPYLRIDFLSWYETGTDANIGTVNKAHGSENYAKALAWIDEAAGDSVEVSLVMPHMYDHAATEVCYGDLVRIDADMQLGGWGNLSGGRQSWQPDWSQWYNPFAGFTGFADRSGRGQLILDGDFMTLSGLANDDERRTAISLMTVTGSPIAIADRVDTIGGCADFYRNPELLELRAQGLVAKPYFSSGTPYSVDSGSRDSERWLGQLPDGSWVVALFNRNDGPGPTTKSIDFAADLGLTAPAAVRDLWTHQDLGLLTGLSTSLAPHASQVVRIVPSEPVRRYQASVAAWGGGANFNNNHTGYSGMGFVDKLETAGPTVTFAVSAPRAGTYAIRYRYANALGADSTMTVQAQTPDRKVAAAPFRVQFPSLADWDTWSTASGTITLAKGVNLVTVARTADDTGAINLNHIELPA